MARVRKGAGTTVSDAAQAVAVRAGGTGEPGRSDEPQTHVQTSARSPKTPLDPVQAAERAAAQREEEFRCRAALLEQEIALTRERDVLAIPGLARIFAGDMLETWRELESLDDGEFSRLKLKLRADEQRELERRMARRESTGGKRRQALAGFGLSELYDEWWPEPYIVKAMLNRGELAVFFGGSGEMKTFVVLDLVLHAASGMEYCGHRVTQTGVLYVAGEGGGALRKRVMAWLDAHEFEDGDPLPALYVATEPVDLLDDAGALEDTLSIAEERLGCEIGLVVFDTLAANFGAGDESSNADMQRLLNKVRHRCGTRAVLFVHHVGHGDKARERGAYALRAGADRRYLVSRPDMGSIVTLSCEKAKDEAPPEPLAFEWRSVTLPWQDLDGDPLTSVVLKPAPYQQQLGQADTARDRKKLESLVAILRETGALRRPELVNALVARNVCRRAKAYALIKEAEGEGLIAEGLDRLAVVDRPDEVAP